MSFLGEHSDQEIRDRVTRVEGAIESAINRVAGNHRGAVADLVAERGLYLEELEKRRNRAVMVRALELRGYGETK